MQYADKLKSVLKLMNKKHN